jgi:hypothetical protein
MMKKRWFLINLLVMGMLLAAAFIFYMTLRGPAFGAALAGASDGGDEAIPTPLDGPQLSGFVLPTPIPGETLVYFVPTDNDATGTEIYLYNSDSVDHTVALRGFNYDGAMVYAQDIIVPASSFRRLVSDSVAAAPPPSWATPAPITTNFTDFVYFASLSLPAGVEAEGNTLFNPGTGVVNPRADQGALPLTFNADATATPSPTPTSSPTTPPSPPTPTAKVLPSATPTAKVQPSATPTSPYTNLNLPQILKGP